VDIATYTYAVGFFVLAYGIYTCIVGRVPFLSKTYNNKKFSKDYFRIQGGAVTVIGIIMLYFNFRKYSTSAILAAVVVVAFAAIIMEIIYLVKMKKSK
jgi:hypothetical protein